MSEIFGQKRYLLVSNLPGRRIAKLLSAVVLAKFNAIGTNHCTTITTTRFRACG